MIDEIKPNDVSKINPEVEKYLREHLSEFIEDFNIDDLSPKTQPSIIAKGDTRQINLFKLDPKDIEKYLWLHPVIPRGIEMKANRMVRRGYNIQPKSENNLAKDAADYCNRLIGNSGGAIFVNRWIKDTYSFGDGYWTLVPNKANNEILRLNPEHPIFFRPATFLDKQSSFITDKNNIRFKLNQKTKEISAYSQVRFKDYSSTEYEPFGNEIPSNRVAHLMFDRYGDEPTGISIVQYVHLTIKYLLNLEEAAAERMWRDGFTQKKVNTEITNDRDLKKLAKNIANINSRDAIILPKGTDVANLIPGTSDFSSFHKIYIQLLAIRLGIPMPLLTLDATSTNKATIDEQRKDILADYSMDELIVEQTIENQIFKVACELKYGEGFKEIPSFKFNEMPDNEDSKVDRFVKTSEAVKNISSAVKDLILAGISTEDECIIELIDYLVSRVKDSKTLVEFNKDVKETKRKIKLEIIKEDVKKKDESNKNRGTEETEPKVEKGGTSGEP